MDAKKLQRACSAFVDEMILCRVNRVVDALLDHPDATEQQWYRDLFLEPDGDTDSESGTREPLEFYAVTEFLAQQLEVRGALVTREFDQPIWGREVSGQRIHLDRIMEDILTAHEDTLSRFWEN